MFSYGIDPIVISSQNYLELPMEELKNCVLKLNVVSFLNKAFKIIRFPLWRIETTTTTKTQTLNVKMELKVIGATS